MNQRFTNQKGYIALIAVLIITAVTLAIGLGMNILSIGETQSGLLKQQSAQSFSAADSCLQEAYLRLKRDNAFSGGSLKVGDGSCTITVVSQGPARIITAASDVSTIVRRVESGVTLAGSGLIIHYWKELY